MEPNFFTVLSKKIVTTVITIGSMFYSTIDGVNAAFDPIEISTKGTAVMIRTRLKSCFTEELYQIFQSGEEIKIHFHTAVFDESRKKPYLEKAFYHSLKYSLVDRVFEVYRSEDQELIPALNLLQAKNALVEIDGYPVITMDELSSSGSYRVQLKARMGKVHIQGMDEPLNLMYYWNSIKPSQKSKPFHRDIFKQ
ncbi:DUF4390 domain-containing protein [Caldithrix abyssi]|nr:DUF4390 domain-containing protein [Caldithrix abyssi]